MYKQTRVQANLSSLAARAGGLDSYAVEAARRGRG